MKDKQITVFVGDTNIELSIAAKDFDSAAKLVTKDNYSDLGPGTYYTSIGDLSNLSQFGQILVQADTIIYAPPATWSDQTMKKWTEDYLKVATFDPYKNVQGFIADNYDDHRDMLWLADQRKSDKEQIWIAGCSISLGMGVADSERYGTLISKKLNLPVSFLTERASSISWAADQILRSDIRKNDIVFWGITSTDRLTYWNDSDNNITYSSMRRFAHDDFLKLFIRENFFASGIVIHQSLTAIHQVINFCRIVGAKLILGTMLEDMEPYLKNFDFFTPMYGFFGRNKDDRFLDIGTDNSHPGPLTHQYYADRFLKIYYELYK